MSAVVDGTQQHPDSILMELAPYLRPGAGVRVVDGIAVADYAETTPGMRANAYYFGRPKWVQGWFEHVHRSPKLRERWHATGGTWDGKVVVDVGCGPGNLFNNLGGAPAALIGVDVARGSLDWAARRGYLPLMADAHSMPLRDGIADVVALNAAIHHCDDMARVIAESARLVRPGGVLMADHDPQLSAYDFRGLGRVLWDLRAPIYRLANRGGHRAADDEQAWAAATEIHHVPGDGVTAELLRGVLEPMGFDVALYPHNHDVGADVLRGAMGRPPRKMRVVQRLSGIVPGSAAGALSLLCVARRRGT